MRGLMVMAMGLMTATSAWASPVKMAVLEFAHQGDNPEWAPLGKGFQEMLLVDLSKAQDIEVVARSEVRAQRVKLGLDIPGEASGRAQLGAQAGATHLLSGTFTVDNDTLVLSAELLSVSDGSIVYQESVRGEAEAFFELEKELVTSTIGSLSVGLGAKERAEVGRLHTTNFLAFQDFSSGLDHFDAERYEASLSALRNANERDTQFSLAAITLDQYGSLIDEIRSKSQAVAVFRAENKRLESLSKAGEGIEVYQRLLAEAGKSGPEHERNRLTALFMLVLAYDETRNFEQRFHAAALQDTFAMKRAGDELARRLHDEGMRIWPRFYVNAKKVGGCQLPDLAEFDKRFARCAETLWNPSGDDDEYRLGYYLGSMSHPNRTAARLHLSLAEEVRLFARFYDMAGSQPEGQSWAESHQKDLVDAYRTVLRLDDSTRLLKQMADATDHVGTLDRIARAVEANKRYTEALRGAKNRRWVEEYLMLEGPTARGAGVDTAVAEFSGATLSEGAAYILTDLREWPAAHRGGFLRVGTTPMWCQTQCRELWSGPRDDPRHTTSLRSYRGAEGAEQTETLLVAGALPVSDLDATFAMGWAAPADFVPQRGAELQKGTSEAEFMFGLNDIDVPLLRDAETQKVSLARPIRGYAIAVTATAIELRQTVEVEHDQYASQFADKVLASSKVKGRVGRVDVAVRGRDVFVRVGDTVLKHRLNAPPEGFMGFRFGGGGFVELKRVQLDGVE